MASQRCRLDGRVALVTGATGSIGNAIVRRLAADGASTVICYRDNAVAAEKAVDEIRCRGGDAVAEQLDVTDAAQVERVILGTASRLGRLDILVNNAGVMRRAAFTDILEADWDVTLDVNLKGSFLCSQVAARVMRSQQSGSIVHVSSTNETIASDRCTAYAVSKGGLRLLMRQMALELGPLGIRTNTVCPGMVETAMNRQELTDAEFRSSAMSRIPLGRFATPSDVAAAVAYLVSDDACFVNGASLPVDGGKVIG